MNFFKLLLLSLFINATVFAQNGFVTGSVVDEATLEPLGYGTITINNEKDSTLLTGVITDSTGQFNLTKIPDGNYYLALKFIGYTEQKLSGVTILKSNTVVYKNIAMSVDSELDAVTVNGEKVLFENKIDKKIFNAAESMEGQGGTGLDMLKAVPLVTVDQNDNILLRGDANVTIFINGRPTAIPANEYLKQIPGSSIDKVELITNPSAKYDPEGMSGIINIILKKEKMSGFNGIINSNFGYSKYHKSTNTLSLNYRSQNLNISASSSYSNRRTWYGGTLDRNVLLNDTLWDNLAQSDYGERKNTSLSGQLGLDYFINDKNALYINGTYREAHNLGSRYIDYSNTDNNQILTAFSQRTGNIDVPMRSYNISGGWQKNFKKSGHNLDIDINNSYFGMDADENLSHDFFDGNKEFSYSSAQNAKELKGFTTTLAKLDYTLPITDSLNLEAGVHYTNRLSTDDFFSASGETADALVEDLGISNYFSYNQKTIASYGAMSKQFKKIGVKVGLRVEQTYTDAKLISSNETFKNVYLKLFPSIHFNYKLKENSELQLSYSKRINRPEDHQLNPFTNYSDPLVLNTGNPFLLPEEIHVNEISYLKYLKKITINLSAYHRVIKNMIRKNLSYNGTQSTVSIINLGSSNLSGTDLILTYKPMKGVRIMSTTSLWNTSTLDTAFSDTGEQLNLLGFTTRLNASAQLKMGWSLQLWSSYTPKQVVLQGYILQNYGGGMAFAKTVLNKKGRVTLSVVDVLNSRQFGFEAITTDSYTFNSVRNWESRAVYLSFNYTFGKMTKGKSKRRSKDTKSGDDKSSPDM